MDKELVSQGERSTDFIVYSHPYADRNRNAERKSNQLEFTNPRRCVHRITFMHRLENGTFTEVIIPRSDFEMLALRIKGIEKEIPLTEELDEYFSDY